MEQLWQWLWNSCDNDYGTTVTAVLELMWQQSWNWCDNSLGTTVVSLLLMTDDTKNGEIRMEIPLKLKKTGQISSFLVKKRGTFYINIGYKLFKF